MALTQPAFLFFEITIYRFHGPFTDPIRLTMLARDDPPRFLLGPGLSQHLLADAAGPAAAAIRQWEQLAAKFEPLLGPGGVRLIYGRSLELNKTAFQWLPSAPPPAADSAPFAALQTRFENRPTTDIVAAHAALLRTFVDLLASLIGERLTTQFLRSVFAADDFHDTSPEQNNDGQN